MRLTSPTYGLYDNGKINNEEEECKTKRKRRKMLEKPIEVESLIKISEEKVKVTFYLNKDLLGAFDYYCTHYGYIRSAALSKMVKTWLEKDPIFKLNKKKGMRNECG